MTDIPSSPRIRLGVSRRRDEIPFDLSPAAEDRAALAEELGVSALRKLRFQGVLRPRGTSDWTLDATLGATIVQPCGITLDPVTTRIDEPVERRYVAGLATADLPAEQEMPEDVSEEPLPASLDLEAVMVEALALAIPPFPRAPGAELGAAQYADSGVKPLQDEDTRPFAGLRDALKGKT